MKTLGNILYRLARFLAGVPPEELGAMVLIALERPELLVALFNPELLAALFALVLFALKYVVGIIISGIVGWYLTSICKIHLWPMLPSKWQRVILVVRDRALLKKPDEDNLTDRDGESAFSRNSMRHPHW